MTRLILIFCFVFTCCCLAFPKGPYGVRQMRDIFCDDPDCDRNVSELIISRGYRVEEYTVQTQDGYLLGLQRIPFGKKVSPLVGPKPVILLQHGLLAAGHTWVIDFPSNSLGYMLADAGFDVWLGNARGNVYSRHHVRLSPETPEFWQFSWDEHIKYDLPSMINFILSKTGSSQIYYVGHSMGTMMGFGGFEDANLASKVKLFVALAPVTHLGNMKALVLKIAADLDIDVILKYFGVGEFAPSSQIMREYLGALCYLDVNICENSMCATMGCDINNWNNTRWPIYAQHDPAGTSVQNIHHMAQCVRSNNFQMYDYGTPEANQQHYNTTVPPMYHVGNLKTKVAIFSGGQDEMADPTDVAALISELPPSLLTFNKVIDYYSHIDFIWGMDAYKVVYDDIIKLCTSMYYE